MSGHIFAIVTVVCGRRITFSSQFSVFALWVLKIDLKALGLVPLHTQPPCLSGSNITFFRYEENVLGVHSGLDLQPRQNYNLTPFVYLVRLRISGCGFAIEDPSLLYL